MPSFWSRLRSGYATTAVIWLNFTVLFLLANLAAFVVLSRKVEGNMFQWFTKPPEFIREALAITYPDLSEDERAELWLDSAIGFEPDSLVQYREKPVDRRYVKIDENGFRVGADQGPWPPVDEAFNVFLFGGSTAFGYGVPDDQTISSHLQAMLREELADAPGVDGRELRVYNFGRGGFNTTMERLLFDKITLTSSAPDLAIFLDGVNDFAYALDPAVLTQALTWRREEEQREPVVSAVRLLPLTQLFKVGPNSVDLVDAAKRRSAVPADLSERETLDLAVRRYFDNKEIIEKTAAAHGVDVLFVLQPTPTYKYDRSYHTFKGKSFGGHERSGKGYPLMLEYVEANPQGDEFLWCADIQDGVHELLYVDKMHYSPGMSHRVARCIADGLVARSGG